MHAMMLTAGLGTRLRPVTDRYPKPVVPFLNVPLLCYPLALMREAGVKRLILNTHHLPDQIEETVQKHAADFDLRFSHEPGAPLGAGGGIGHARAHLIGGGTFLVANGDEVILPREEDTLQRFRDEHRESRALATILVMEHPLVGTQFGGVWASADGSVVGFGKQALPGAAKGYHYIGLLLLDDRVFEYIGPGESNILYDGLAAAIRAGEKVRVCVGSFTWFETGNPTDFLEGTRHALECLRDGAGIDARFLHSITSHRWTMGSRFDADRLQLIGSTTSIAGQLEGFAVIGDGARVDDGARVKNAVILPGAHVRAGETIENKIYF